LKAIEVDSLSKKFGDFKAVDNISFKVEEGRFLVFWDQMVQEKVLQ